MRNFEILSIIYPEKVDLTIETIKTPKDIKKQINKLSSVKRFVNSKYFAKDMIPDDSKAHTIRCVHRALTIPYKGRGVERALWIHDIPEMDNEEDSPVQEKYKNRETSRKTNEKELRAAKKIFNKKDFELYKNFQEAEEYLVGFSYKIPKMQEMLVASMIDRIDGNLVFHYYVPKWIQKNKGVGKYSTTNSLSQIIKIHKSFVKALSNKKVDRNIRETCLDLRKQQLEQLIKNWSSINPKYLPKRVKKELEEIKEMLN